MPATDSTLAELGWPALLAELTRRARTRRGEALCDALQPFADRSAALHRQREVSEARALHDAAQPMVLDGVRDLEESLRRSDKGGALEAAALVDVATTLRAGAALRKHLVRHREGRPTLAGRAALISDLDELADMLERAFVRGESEEGGPAGPRIADSASAALGGLRRRARAIRDELERALERLLDASDVAPHLQERYFTQRDDRYVLPIRVEGRAKVKGIVHGSSQSGQTVFVEPEAVVELNNRKKLAEWEVAEEERRILVALSAEVQAQMSSILVNLDVLAHLDLVGACARLADDLHATPPDLAEAGEALDLRRARHPLMVLSGRTCVPNDIIVGDGQALVVSGPNAGGKTVALKIAGLLVWMTRCGLHLPAQEGSRVPPIDSVVCDVGDAQNLEQNLSTFSGHVARLIEFLAAARPGTLVLLDEIAGGTDPGEGAALAQAVLEGLVERGAMVIATTHYDRLRLLPSSDSRFVNASVGFDVDKLAPTFTLTLGIPGASAALAVARRLGLDSAVVDRAQSISGDGPRGLEQLLQNLEAERSRLAEARARAEELASAAETQRALAESRAEEARVALAEARRGAHDAAVATLREARAELDERATVLRRNADGIGPAELAAQKRAIDAAAAKVHGAAPSPMLPPGRAATLDDLSPGASVFVARLGGRAIVLERPRGKKVLVQAGPLKVSVGLDEIHVPHAPAAPVSARTLRGHNGFEFDTPSADRRRGLRTLDVRGERVDVAVGLLEKFLDDALRSGEEAILVIHGHGTGALRDMLRKELRRFPGIAGVDPAPPDQGGDGATIAKLG